MWQRAVVMHDSQPPLAPCLSNEAEGVWHTLVQSTGVCCHHKDKERFGAVCDLYNIVWPVCTLESVANCSLTPNVKLHHASANLHACKITTWHLLSASRRHVLSNGEGMGDVSGGSGFGGLLRSALLQ